MRATSRSSELKDVGKYKKMYNVQALSVNQHVSERLLIMTSPVEAALVWGLWESICVVDYHCIVLCLIFVKLRV